MMISLGDYDPLWDRFGVTVQTGTAAGASPSSSGSSGAQQAQTGSQSAAERCSSDTSLWVTVLADNGRCYTMCVLDPNSSWEIECPDRGDGKEPGGKGLSASTLIKGVPDWVTVLGGAALAVLIVNR